MDSTDERNQKATSKKDINISSSRNDLIPTSSTAISTAAGGAALGTFFGGPVGAVIGAVSGLAISFATTIFHHKKEETTKFNKEK